MALKWSSEKSCKVSKKKIIKVRYRIKHFQCIIIFWPKTKQTNKKKNKTTRFFKQQISTSSSVYRMMKIVLCGPWSKNMLTFKFTSYSFMFIEHVECTNCSTCMHSMVINFTGRISDLLGQNTLKPFISKPVACTLWKFNTLLHPPLLRGKSISLIHMISPI